MAETLEKVIERVRAHLKSKYGEIAGSTDQNSNAGWLAHIASGQCGGDDTEFWGEVFRILFVENFDDTNDDLLFFVYKNRKEHSEPFFVLRHHSPKVPQPGDPAIEWEETFYLNLILRSYTYTLTIVVGRKPPQGPMQVLSKVERKMYPSPSRTRMDTAKGTVTEMTYPHIFFPIDDFNDFFKSVTVNDGEQVCVELVASAGNFRTAMFQGSVSHAALMQAYGNKKSSGSAWEGFAQLMKTTRRMEFLKMRGPKGIGQAEMAVSIVEETPPTDASGKPYPLSAPGTPTGQNRQGGGAMRKLFGGTLAAFQTQPPTQSRALNACLTFVNIRACFIAVYALRPDPAKPVLDRLQPVSSPAAAS
eukprot:comp71897_c0_seq1/m.48158 comp71897_c0_seq1/g.48158  ORF comp71897_c0_seq1/g.48158 comp71897_c0_seq1/m.48158 type:complete len:361 (-) comp71897_c0_seq1:81-1163(-)